MGYTYRGHRSGPNKTGPLRLPEWQLVPGTRFVVDKFGGKAVEAAPQTKHWFLTHFHADHYGGLGPRFKQGLSDGLVCMLGLSGVIWPYLEALREKSQYLTVLSTVCVASMALQLRRIVLCMEMGCVPCTPMHAGIKTFRHALQSRTTSMCCMQIRNAFLPDLVRPFSLLDA